MPNARGSGKEKRTRSVRGKPQQSRSRARAQCDSLFSKLIRERDGHCLNCGGHDFLQCAHIVSRDYKAVRCSPDNAVCLCRSCHVYFTHRKIEWDVWVETMIGREAYDGIKSRALTYQTPDWFEVLERLKTHGLFSPDDA